MEQRTFKSLNLSPRQKKMMVEAFEILAPEMWCTLQNLEETFDGLISEFQIKVLNEYRDIYNENKLTYEDQANRMRQIRKDRNMKAEQFAQELSSPKGSEPFPDEDILFKAKTIYDLEYGKVEIGEKMGALVFAKSGINPAWLLRGEATPFTMTNTITIPRIVAIEEQVAELDRVVNQNVGRDELAQMVKEDHPLVIKDDQGRPAMPMLPIPNLETDLDSNSRFQSHCYCRGNRESLQDLRDLVRATRRDYMDLPKPILVIIRGS